MAKREHDKDMRGIKLLPGETQLRSGRKKGLYVYQEKRPGQQRKSVTSWRLRPSDPVPSGKRFCKSLRELEGELQTSMDNGTAYTGIKTLDDYFQFLMETSNFKPKGKQTKRERWNHVTFKNKPVKDVKRTDVIKLLSDMNKAGYAKDTIQGVNSVLVCVLDLAWQDDAVTKNVAVNVAKNMHLQPSEPRKALTKEQQTSLLTFIRSEPKLQQYDAFITFMLGTGCRIGELGALQWEDIDFAAGVIHINKALSQWQDNGHHCAISSTKTNTGVRDIPLLSDVRAVLLRHKTERVFHMTELDGYKHFVFLTPNGRLMTISNADSIIRKIVKAYNTNHEEPLPKISSHILRHTYCTRLCESCSDLNLIMNIMGHANLNTTMKIYADCQTDHKMDAFKALDKAFNLA